MLALRFSMQSKKIVCTAIAWVLLAGILVAQDGLPRALELYRTGDYKGAQVIFERILQTEPKNLTVMKMLAECLAHQNLQQAARQQYEKILQISPGDVDATRALRPAPTPSPRPAPPPAKPAVPEVVERVRAGGEIERAEREIQAGRLEEAAVLLEALHKKQPDAIVPQQRLAEIYTRTKQYSRAAELYASLAALPGGSGAFLQRAAQNYAFAENYPDAIRLYRQYLLLNPGDLPASLDLANVLLWSNQLDEAIVAYRRYLDRRPDEFDARQNLGNALLWSKQYQAALDEFTKLATRRPRDPELNLAMAQCYDQMGKTEAALALYQKVLEIRPTDSTATEARDRLVSNAPRVNALARMEQQDYKGAAEFFLSYLDKHPDSTETLLQVARVFSWGKRYTDAAKYYDLYLQRVPSDKTAVRELAKVELTIPVFSRARQDYELLTKDPRSTVEDYEGLVHAYVWDGKLAQAQPDAKKLLELDPENEVARETIRTYDSQQKFAAIDRARTFTGAGRYGDAVAAYKSYIAAYGSSREVDLALARVYSFDKQYASAVSSYQNYLARYPDDTQARLELADNEKYNKDYIRAEADYRSALKVDTQRNPQQETQALLGIAQIMDYRGDDAFRVAQAYRQVQQRDTTNLPAYERLEQLAPQIAPSLGYTDRTFSDSDGFGRSTNGIEASFPLAGGLRFTPYASFDYFSQLRQVGGANCGSVSSVKDPQLIALSSSICAANGTSRGFGGGVRVGLSAGSHFSLNLEGGELRFNNTRSDVQLKAEAFVHGAGDKLLSLSYAKRSGAYDLNTMAAMFAGITGQNAFVSYQQPLNERWRLWFAGGLGRYTKGLNNTSPQNTQKIFSARADYKVMPELTAGYFMRATTFSNASPLYFSPSYYGTFGFFYDYRKPIAPNVSLSATGEAGYGRINRYNVAGVNTVEFAIYPAIVWRVRPGIDLKIGYRFGRGSTSTFGSQAYTTGLFDFGLTNYFMPQSRPADPARLDIH